MDKVETQAHPFHQVPTQDPTGFIKASSLVIELTPNCFPPVTAYQSGTPSVWGMIIGLADSPRCFSGLFNQSDLGSSTPPGEWRAAARIRAPAGSAAFTKVVATPDIQHQPCVLMQLLPHTLFLRDQWPFKLFLQWEHALPLERQGFPIPLLLYSQPIGLIILLRIVSILHKL